MSNNGKVLSVIKISEMDTTLHTRLFLIYCPALVITFRQFHESDENVGNIFKF